MPPGAGPFWGVFAVRSQHGPRNGPQSPRSEVPNFGIRRNAPPDSKGIETVWSGVLL
jgi:hypothetical protein